MGKQLVDLMKRMAADDAAALFVLLDQHRSELTKTVRWILHDLGRPDAGSSAADLEFLVQTAALVVYDRAQGWKPGGAAPWVWASRSIRAEIVAWLGHPRVEFDSRLHEHVAAPTASSKIDLREMAARDSRVARWIETVSEAANERDQAVHLEYQTQKHLGDRSPAHTVGAMFDLSPANVRQIDTRVRRRIRQLHTAG